MKDNLTQLDATTTPQWAPLNEAFETILNTFPSLRAYYEKHYLNSPNLTELSDKIWNMITDWDDIWNTTKTNYPFTHIEYTALSALEAHPAMNSDND